MRFFTNNQEQDILSESKQVCFLSLLFPYGIFVISFNNKNEEGGRKDSYLSVILSASCIFVTQTAKSLSSGSSFSKCATSSNDTTFGPINVLV